MQQQELRVVPTVLYMHRLQSQSDSLTILSTLGQADWDRLDVQLQNSSGERLHEVLLESLQKLGLPSPSAKATKIMEFMPLVQAPLLAKLLEYQPPADSDPPFIVWRIPLAQWREEKRGRESSPEFTMGGLRWRLFVSVNGEPDHQPPGCLACYLELQDPPASGISCRLRMAALHPSNPNLSKWSSTAHKYHPKADSWGWRGLLQPVQLAEFTHEDGCLAIKVAVAQEDEHGFAEWPQPRCADYLLLHFACELSSADLTLLWPFVTQLIEILHARGFDLNQRDAEGRTLLTQYAARSEKPEGVALVQLLLKRGACASVESLSGSSLFRVWVRLGLRDLLLAAFHGSPPWQCLPPQLEVWQLSVSGASTFIQLVESKAASWSEAAISVRELAYHWRRQKRRMLLRCVSEFTQLMPDLAHVVLSYLDGQGRPSDG